MYLFHLSKFRPVVSNAEMDMLILEILCTAVLLLTTRSQCSTVQYQPHPCIRPVGAQQTESWKQEAFQTFSTQPTWNTCLMGFEPTCHSTCFSSDLVKKFLPNFCQWSFMISSTLCFLVAKIDNHASTAHRPSFSRMWSEPGWLGKGGG